MSFKQILKNSVKRPLDSLAAQFGHHRRYSNEPRLWIMMYHRILPKDDPRFLLEEPGMIVEPETFRMHLRTLKNEFTIISLEEWVLRKKKNLPLPEKSCVITFDDGWLDNYEFAFPILQQEQIPATLFAVSDMIGSNQTFWPNRIQTILKSPKEQLCEIPWLSEFINTSDFSKEISAGIIYSLKHRSDSELIDLIEKTESDLSIPTPTFPVLVSSEQLREMSESRLVDIGSHTSNHIRLVKGLAVETYRAEIANSKTKLESIIEKPINLFCYPNGDYCDDAIKEVSRHYDAAVTTQKGIISGSTNELYTLSRFGVHQDISNNKRQLLSRVSNWP